MICLGVINYFVVDGVEESTRRNACEGKHYESETASNNATKELAVFRLVFHSKNHRKPFGCRSYNARQPFPE